MHVHMTSVANFINNYNLCNTVLNPCRSIHTCTVLHVHILKFYQRLHNHYKTIRNYCTCDGRLCTDTVKGNVH